MKSLRSLAKGNVECMAGYAAFAVAAVYILYNKQPETVGLAAGVALILYVLTAGNVLVSSVLGALVGLVALYYSRTPMARVEGFADDEEKEEGFEDDEEKEGFQDEEKEEGFEDDEEKEGFQNEDEEKESFQDEEKEEGFEDKPKKVKKVKKARKAVPPPDNGDRAEFLTLGKKYKLPNEKDDEDYHLDAGTTFLNAYKSLKPDQIASMSKDTQELMQTQKQLMGTLATLKPLINDGKEMMSMFSSYFGKGGEMQ